MYFYFFVIYKYYLITKWCLMLLIFGAWDVSWTSNGLSMFPVWRSELSSHRYRIQYEPDVIVSLDMYAEWTPASARTIIMLYRPAYLACLGTGRGDLAIQDWHGYIPLRKMFHHLGFLTLTCAELVIVTVTCRSPECMHACICICICIWMHECMNEWTNERTNELCCYLLLGWCFSAESVAESGKPMTTNILMHMKSNMLKSLWNSKFSDPFHQPIDEQVTNYKECCVIACCLIVLILCKFKQICA